MMCGRLWPRQLQQPYNLATRSLSPSRIARQMFWAFIQCLERQARRQFGASGLSGRDSRALLCHLLKLPFQKPAPPRFSALAATLLQLVLRASLFRSIFHLESAFAPVVRFTASSSLLFLVATS